MNLPKICAEKTIGKRLKEIRIQKGLSQEKVAKATKISRSALGRYENDKQKLTPEYISILSDFYKISCDTLILGIQPKCYGVNQITGLNDSAMRWLYRVKKMNPEMLNTINTVLGHREIAEPLFEAFYIYAWLKIPEFVQYDDGSIMGRVSRSLSDEETLLKNVMAEHIHEILLQVRNQNDEERFKQSEEKMRMAIEKFQKEMENKKKANTEYEKEQKEMELLNDDIEENFLN